MARPDYLYRLIAALAAEAGTVRDFEVAAGRPVPTLVALFSSGDRSAALKAFGAALNRCCAVLEGSEPAPWIITAGEAFVMACATSAASTSWDELDWNRQRDAASRAGFDEPKPLAALALRLGDTDPVRVAPGKPLLLWCAVDRLYRLRTVSDQQWTLEQIFEAALAGLRKQPWMIPLLRAAGEVKRNWP